MKHLILIIATVLSGCSFAFGQNPSTANFSRGNADNPMLDFIFQQYRNQKEKKTEVVGSPFLNENFEKAAIYSTDGIEGYVYARYDGYNDEIQLKENLIDEEIKMLLQRKDIHCVLNGTEIIYTEYYDKKNESEQGYLYKVFESKDITLFERKMKKYKDGKKATTSLEITVPNKFVVETEFYYTNSKEKTVRFLKPSKKNILELFEDDKKAEAIKKFISKNNLKLKETKDIIRIFDYYKTL